MRRIVKTTEGYKLTEEQHSLLRSLLRKIPKYVQFKKYNNPAWRESSDPKHFSIKDLVFKNELNAQLYIDLDQFLKLDENNRHYLENLKYRLKAAICQLETIFDKANINPQDYNWVDLW